MKRALYAAIALVIVIPVVGALMGRRPVSVRNTGAGELRIVSLAPSVTEVLFVLGVGDRLIGVTDCCDYPPEAKQVHCVGQFGVPNIEELLALAPDLVIITDLKQDAIEAYLRESGIRVVRVKDDNIANMFDTIKTVGREVGRAERAERFVADMRSQLDGIAQTYSDVPEEDRPRVFVEVWNDPIMTVGRQSFVDELVSHAGGVNVARAIDLPYPAINPEKVIEWDPEVIVLGYMNSGQAADRLAGRIGWDDIEAVRTGRTICDISSDLLLRPGPRLPEAVRLLNRRLYAHREHPAAGRASTSVESGRAASHGTAPAGTDTVETR